MKRKVLSVVLTLALVVTMIPAMTLVSNADTNVAKIGDTNYATLDEAILAANSASEAVTIELLKDVELSAKATTFSNTKKITIDGKNYSITGKTDANKKAMLECTGTIEIKNVKISTNSGFKRCLLVTGGNVTLNNVVLDNSKSYLPEGEEYKGACIINNGGSVTVKGNCTFITGKNSWAAIDLSKESSKDATLTFEANAKVAFIDGRTAAEKDAEPLIGLDKDNAWTVTGFEKVGLVMVTKDAKKAWNASTTRNKDGYDLRTFNPSGIFGMVATGIATITGLKIVKSLVSAPIILKVIKNFNNFNFFKQIFKFVF